MKLGVTHEARFLGTQDGKVWSNCGADYSFWKRYLSMFSLIEVFARVDFVENLPHGYSRADGNVVQFLPVPYYIGPYQYVRVAKEINILARDFVRSSEAVILRTPGQMSSCVFRYLRNTRHPYGVEVVGDPFDVFAPGSIDHPLRCFFRWRGTKQVEEQCKKAVAAAYVTDSTLQKRYPNASYSTSYSSIDIRKDAYESSPRVEFGIDGIFRLVLVGSLAQLYKSPDILINSVALCCAKGFKIKLKIIGDGKFKPQLEDQVSRLGLNDVITFMGQLPAGTAVRDEMLNADLFVLPSRTEGLPRAMIEAMACGLPCIGSDVGGIPELLPSEDLVPPGDTQALADIIEAVITNPGRMQDMSARNLERALEFRNDILENRRREFYNHLREKTSLWMEGTKVQ